MLATTSSSAKTLTPPLPATLELRSKVLKACRRSIERKFGGRNFVRLSDLLGCVRRVSFGDVCVMQAVMKEEEILLTVKHKRGKSHGFFVKPQVLTKKVVVIEG
jgi:hypothetical protein